MARGDLDLSDRAALFRTLEERIFDLAVIGGGITGAGIARDAAQRGLSVALIEMGDFASGTSSRSSKLIHGGLRYLAQGDLALVREAASERKVLRRIAPELARETPFIVPARSAASLAKLKAGLWTFERLGGVDKTHRHESWSAGQLAVAEPAVATEAMVGAIVYPEYLTDDARLTLANVRTAAADGAVVASYARAERILVEAGRATGLEVVEKLPSARRAARPGQGEGHRQRGRSMGRRGQGDGERQSHAPAGDHPRNPPGGFPRAAAAQSHLDHVRA